LKECHVDSFYSTTLLISQEGKAELPAGGKSHGQRNSFFRHKAQLDLFQKYVLERIAEAEAAHREYSIRVWSADARRQEATRWP